MKLIQKDCADPRWFDNGVHGVSQVSTRNDWGFPSIAPTATSRTPGSTSNGRRTHRNFGWKSSFIQAVLRWSKKKGPVTRTATEASFDSSHSSLLHSVSRSALWLAAEVLEPVSSIAAAIGNRRASPTTLPLARPAQTCLPIINQATKQKSGGNNESSHLLYAISTSSRPAHASVLLQSFRLGHF